MVISQEEADGVDVTHLLGDTGDRDIAGRASAARAVDALVKFLAVAATMPSKDHPVRFGEAVDLALAHTRALMACRQFFADSGVDLT